MACRRDQPAPIWPHPASAAPTPSLPTPPCDSSSGSGSSETGLASARFRPASKIDSPIAAVTPKIATIGTRSSGLAAPIAVEMTAPVPSWKKPSRADCAPRVPRERRDGQGGRIRVRHPDAAQEAEQHGQRPGQPQDPGPRAGQEGRAEDHLRDQEAVLGTPNPAASSGNAGRYMSMANGLTTLRAPSREITNRPDCFARKARHLLGDVGWGSSWDAVRSG